MKLSNAALGAVRAAYCLLDTSPEYQNKKHKEMKRCLRSLLDKFEPAWRACVVSDDAVTEGIIAEVESWLKHIRAAHPKLKTEQSKARAAICLYLPLGNGHGTPTASAAWQAYIESHPAPPAELNVLAGAATRDGVEPAAMSNAYLEKHRARLLVLRPLASVDQTMRRLTAAFRKQPLPGCASDLPTPGKMQRRPLTELHPTVLAELKDWRTLRIEGCLGMKAVRPLRALQEVTMLHGAIVDYANCNNIAVGEVETCRVLMSVSALKRVLQVKQDRAKACNAGWGALAYDVGLTIVKMAIHGPTYKEAFSQQVVETMQALVREFAPKKKSLTPVRWDLLRPYTKVDRFAELVGLPELVVARFRSQVSLDSNERSLLMAAFAMQLTIDVPELPDVLASIRLDQIHDTGVGESRRIRLLVEEHDPQVVEYGDVPPKLDCELPPESFEIYDVYRRLVIDQPRGQRETSLFPGRGGGSIHPSRLRLKIKSLTRSDLHPEGLSILELRLIMAFGVLAADPTARDLAAGYLDHVRMASLAPLIHAVKEWRGSLRSWEQS